MNRNLKENNNKQQQNEGDRLLWRCSHFGALRLGRAARQGFDQRGHATLQKGSRQGKCMPYTCPPPSPTTTYTYAHLSPSLVLTPSHIVLQSPYLLVSCWFFVAFCVFFCCAGQAEMLHLSVRCAHN